jgi:hypothetical protein
MIRVLTIIEIVIAIVGIVTGIIGLTFFKMPIRWAVAPFLASISMMLLAVSNIRRRKERILCTNSL